MKRYLIYIYVALCSMTALHAQTFADSTIVYTKAMADSAYAAADYAAAIHIYEHLIHTQGEAAAVYYNLGNSF